MTKRTISFIVLFIVALCVLIPKAQAQSTASCVKGFSWCCQGALCGGSGGPAVPLPPTAQCSQQPSSDGCTQCWVQTDSHDAACAATDVAPDCPTCSQGSLPPALVGQPINLATGNTYIDQTDISIPGLGGGLRLTRRWNSIMPSVQRSYPFMFGTNWRSNFEQRLVATSDGFLKYTQPNSGVSSFGVHTLSLDPSQPSVFNAVVPPNDTTTTITQGYSGSTPTWTLISQNGEKRIFDGTTGVLTSITDRNGNVTALSYDASHRLATVTDPAGRHLYFNYGSGSSNLVSTVTTDFGMTLSYTYDSNGRLTQVTKPDNTTISFAYDSNSYITTVTDSNGKVLESHTYDASGRGLTSSRANGVDAVTISY